MCFSVYVRGVVQLILEQCRTEICSQPRCSRTLVVLNLIPNVLAPALEFVFWRLFVALTKLLLLVVNM